MSSSSDKIINQLEPQELLKLLEIAYGLKKAMARDQYIPQEQIELSRPMLMQLLEYLVCNISNSNLDHSLIPFIEKVLGIKYSKTHDKDYELEEEMEELSAEERKQRDRWIIYKIYQMLSPNQLAGETALDNFISNVAIRGIEVAMQYAGKENADKIDIENLESYKPIVRSALNDLGAKGFGRGL